MGRAKGRGRWGARRTDRDQRAAAVLREALHGVLQEGTMLLIDEPDPVVAQELARIPGVLVRRWSRMSRGQEQGEIWPHGGGAHSCALRMPRTKAALSMALSAAAAQMNPGGSLWVYGANDEGIRSVEPHFSPLFGHAETVLTKKHCRVWRTLRTEVMVARPELGDWKTSTQLPRTEFGRPWVGYPGLFARGGLDPGTALLMDALTDLPEPQTRVLDFACGSGIIAAALDGRWPGVAIHGCDADAIALAAATENLPQVRFHLSDGFTHVPHGPFDVIVSNPPIHWGKDEDHSILSQLIHGAPERLTKGGALWMVVQREVPLHRTLEAVFSRVVVVEENSRFRIWSAR